MTKICTTLRLTPTEETAPVDGPDGQIAAPVVDAKIVDVSTVPDDHQFGMDGDGLMHVEGKIAAQSFTTACDPPAAR